MTLWPQGRFTKELDGLVGIQCQVCVNQRWGVGIGPFAFGRETTANGERRVANVSNGTWHFKAPSTAIDPMTYTLGTHMPIPGAS
jgi:hypothetical protein